MVSLTHIHTHTFLGSHSSHGLILSHTSHILRHPSWSHLIEDSYTSYILLHTSHVLKVSESVTKLSCLRDSHTDLAGLVRSERLSEGGRTGRGPGVVGAEWRGAGGRHGAGGEGRVVQGVLTGVNTRGLAAH